MGNNNSVPQNRDAQNNGAEDPAEEDVLEVVKTVCLLPEKVEQLRLLQDQTTEVLQERNDIIQKLRDIATYLEKTHNSVLIADRVGTGVGIGAGCLVLGGIVAAPFTAGLSLGLTVTGIATGVAGGLTSAGANITGFVLEKRNVASLEEELKKHLEHVEELSSSDSAYLSRTLRIRPTLETLGNLSKEGWTRLIVTLQKLIPLALSGNYDGINRIVNHGTDPNIKSFLQHLRLPMNPELLQTLAEFCTLIYDNICSIMNAIKAFLNFFKKPELARLAMVYTGSAAAMRTTTTTTAAEIATTFRGTPMAMTRTARVAAGALTTAFIVVDVIHMVRIWNETGETPTVQKLRNMADDLENEIRFSPSETENNRESGELDNAVNQETD
ncbi:hypothetical protein GHT06_022196 [Daphnia sinensis]|uniref:Apolipoprotein L3-like n=1 Tax=Daphnia sinensis TaxID=1820382 RepID=A0AAD5KWN8_9CRUS|nr:hypothetical protein GHT06_022196 [Daphnia sinensis]